MAQDVIFRISPFSMYNRVGTLLIAYSFMSAGYSSMLILRTSTMAFRKR